MAYNNKRITIGSHISFAESGKTIDGITVAVDAKPDVDPLENWSPLGCVQTVNFEAESDEEEDYCPSVAGPYVKEVTKSVVSDFIDLQIRDHNELVWRMLWGVDEIVSNDTPYIPFNTSDRSVYVWLKVHGIETDGNRAVISDLWGKLTLTDYPGWSKDATRPTVRFQVLPSPLNAAEFKVLDT